MKRFLIKICRCHKIKIKSFFVYHKKITRHQFFAHNLSRKINHVVFLFNMSMWSTHCSRVICVSQSDFMLPLIKADSKWHLLLPVKAGRYKMLSPIKINCSAFLVCVPGLFCHRPHRILDHRSHRRPKQYFFFEYIIVRN